jgi:hypothetical protein
MPARDVYHQTVKQALIKDGWTITHDPLKLSWGGKDMYVDLGAERLLAAEKAGQKIAVEIKSFTSDSEMADLEQALGQYLVYHAVMAAREPDRVLYLAVPHDVWLNMFAEPLGQLLLQTYPVRLVSFDISTGEFVQWTS